MKNRISFSLLLLACLLLAGCSGGGSAQQAESEDAPPLLALGGQQIPSDTTAITAVLSPGETAQLGRFYNLRRADLSGSEDYAEIAAWAAAHPDVIVRYTVPLPDGSVLSSDEDSCDLSAMSGADCVRAAEALRLLPALRIIRLGGERSDLSWDDLVRIRALLPEAELHYAFTLYGQDCDLANTLINLRGVRVYDGGAEVRRVMSLMPQLKLLDMDSCGVSNEEMEAIRLDFPGVKVVWRVWFGDKYSVRTDVERILASRPTVGGPIFNDSAANLYYCHDVIWLDLGHNGSMTDISFVRGMPKLQVAILAMCGWSDASPLADCPELEYLEMFSTKCTDLSPLSGLKKLRHLNIASILELRDISPLYSLTELERLWIGNYNYVPQEQVDEMQRRAPNCWINTTVYDDPTVEQWRYHDWDPVPRYAVLLEQFDHYRDAAYSYAGNDPLYLPPPDGAQ